MRRATAAPTGPFEIGRDDAAGLSVPDPSVSRRHLVLLPGEDGWRWRDLGSKNGTRRLDAAADAPLRGIAWLSLGGTLLRVETDVAAARPMEPPSPADVLADILALTGAAGVVVADTGAEMIRLAVGSTAGPSDEIADQDAVRVSLYGLRRPDPLTAVERNLVLAIGRQALLSERANRTGRQIQTALRSG